MTNDDIRKQVHALERLVQERIETLETQLSLITAREKKLEAANSRVEGHIRRAKLMRRSLEAWIATAQEMLDTTDE